MIMKLRYRKLDIKQYEKNKLLDWIDISKLNCDRLSINEEAMYLLEHNKDIIYWSYLSSNENAIHLLEKNQDKIDWNNLSKNKNAIHLL